VLIVALVAGALGAPVVFDGDADDALQRVSKRTDEPLEPVSLPSLVVSQQPVFTGGEMFRCQRNPVGLEVIRDGLSAADGHLLDGDLDGALSAIADTEQKLACLNEAVDTQSAGRLYFVQGVVQHAQGNQAKAVKSFQRARAIDPEMAWDNDFPPDGKALFEVTAAAGRVTVQVVPAPNTLTVDGGLATSSELELAPGVHLIGIGKTTLMLDVQRDGRLTFPAQWAASGLAGLSDPVRQQALQESFSDLSRPVFVVAEEVWRVDDGWSIAEVQRRQKFKAGGSKVPLVAGLATAGLALVGGTVGIFSGSSQEGAIKERLQNVPSVSADDMTDEARKANIAYGLGYTSLGVGVGLGVTSVLLFK
jgi:hypothetical protein